MKRVVLSAPQAVDGPVHLAAIETNVLDRFPSLVAHCAVTRYSDGEIRQPGWITVRTSGTAWSVVMKDPDAAAQLTASAASLDDALTLAELLLSADAAPWEPDPFLADRKKKSRK